MEKYILITAVVIMNNTRFRLYTFQGWLSMPFM